MNDPFQFADVLGQYVHQAGYTPGQLARMTGIPKTTIVSWLEGSVKKPRQWRDMIKLAVLLHLGIPQLTALLRAAGFPSVKELLEMVDNSRDRDLLLPWGETAGPQIPPAPFQAIPDLPYFVGREREMDLLKDALLSGRRMAICSLQGMGGVGKTALAAHLAYQLRTSFPDGVLWARLDSSETLSILSTFAKAYGQSVNDYPDLDSRSRVVREILSNKRALVVLDHARNSDEITPLLPPSGECAVLVTTRRHDLFVTQGCHRFRVGPFSAEKRESLALFSILLSKGRALQDEAALCETAELLGHLPLAVAIAAGRLAYEPEWSASDFLKRVRREKQRLDELSYENQSIRLSINLSYNALSPGQQQFFAALSVFDGEGFSPEAVAYVTDQSLEYTQDTLRKLYSLSLVQNEQPGRFCLHPLLRDFAREKMSRPHFFDRMVEYFVRFAMAHETEYLLLDMEHRNILAALEIAFQRGLHEALVEGINAFYHFLQTRCLSPLVEMHLSRAHQSAQRLGNVRKQVLVLLKRGQNACHRAEYPQAEACLFEAAAYPNLPFDLQAMIDLQLGQVFWRQGRLEAARLNFEQALSRVRAFEGMKSREPASSAGESLPASLAEAPRQVEADSLRMLGNLALHKGEYGEAQGLYEQALGFSREINDQQGESAALNNLGIIAMAQGDYTQARTYYEQTLQIYGRMGYRSAEGRLLNNLGIADLCQGNYFSAQTSFEHALRVSQETSDRGGQCLASTNLCGVLLDRGEFSRAEEYGKLALTISLEIGGQLEEGNARHGLGLVYERLGDYPTAQTYLTQALCIRRKIGEPPGEAETLLNLALLYHHLQDHRTAYQHCEQVLQKLQPPWDAPLRGQALLCLGHTLAALDALAEAAEAYSQVLEIRQPSPYSPLAGEAYAGLARVFQAQGKWSQARDQVEKLCTLLQAHPLNGALEPFRLYLTCYRILHFVQDPRALDILASAHHLLYQWANHIDDADLKRSFLYNVPAHQEIRLEFTRNEQLLLATFSREIQQQKAFG